MEYALLLNICERFSTVFHIPFRIYKKNVLLRNLIPGDYPLSAFEKPFETFLENPRPVQSTVTECRQQLGFVRLEESDLAAGVGPVCLTRVTEDNVLPLLKRDGLPEDLASGLTAYLNAIPCFSDSGFDGFLKLLYSVFNGAVYEDRNYTEKDLESYSVLIDRDLTKMNEDILNGDKSRHPSQDIEQEMLFYITNGMVEKLKKADFMKAAGTMGITAADTSRALKNAVIISNTLCCRAAIKGGVPPETAYGIAEINARRIEQCRTTSELEKLSKALRIDYCTRVHNIRYGEANNLVTVRATRYIRDHIYGKITLQDIADDQNVSVSYISTRFKADMGISVVDYVNRLKVEEAQYLLRFTDNPLSMISNSLSFSSQSYFQNIFKKYAGCTPAEYRQNEKRLS